MSQLQRIKADLLEKRLWPIAVLLVAALVAAPVLLRHQPADDPAPAAAAPVEGPSPEATLAAASSVLGVEPPVTMKRGTATRGARRDPFAVPATPEPQPAGGGAGASASPGSGSGTSSSGSPSSGSVSVSPAPSSGSASGSSSSSSSSSPDPRPVPRTVAPSGPATPPSDARPAVYRLLRADVRFDHTVLHDVVRLKPLPGARAPLALYLGPTTGGRGAAFVISGGAEVSGDGRCRPRKRLCTHLILEPAEQATLTLGESRHTLRLLRIRTDRTTDRVAAERFYARQSERGRCVLDVLDFLGFDAETGTVAPHHDGRECEYVLGNDGATVGAR
jgi:hypothetical protein